LAIAVIAAMTVGKDVGSLFPNVVKCIQTENLELKKLVYLYVINYARTQPNATLLAVNTFQKDAQDANPLIRALAVRTMGCIRVDKITEYLCDPLQKTLKARSSRNSFRCLPLSTSSISQLSRSAVDTLTGRRPLCT
jgi:vesicle coat complex subunit